MTATPKAPRLLASLALATLLLSGCSTPPKGAGAGKYAAVELHGFSRASIDLATEQVMEEAGYKLDRRTPDGMIFDKQATSTQNLVWGGWQTGLWDRVQTRLSRRGEGDDFVLSADAYRVISKDDAVLEEERKMGFAVQAKYQKLLEKVKTLLDPLPEPKSKTKTTQK
jgi:hypothetical protein